MNKEKREKIHDLVDQIIDLIDETTNSIPIISNLREPEEKVVFILKNYK